MIVVHARRRRLDLRVRQALANRVGPRFARFDRFIVDAMPLKRVCGKFFLVSAKPTQRLDLRVTRAVDE